MNVSIDFETRSLFDLKGQTPYTYFAHPSTTIMCCAVKIDDQPTRVWSPLFFREDYKESITDEELADIISNADTFHAFNTGFERQGMELLIRKDLWSFGLSPIPVEKWRCTAALALSYALPPSLEEVAQVLGLPMQKDATGNKIMRKLSKPLSKTQSFYYTTSDYRKLCEYCIQDVETEYAIAQRLGELHPKEQKLWELDQLINDTGVQVDIEGVNKLVTLVRAEEEKLLAEVSQITKGDIISVRQRDAVINWLKDNGVYLEDLTKQSVEKALTEELDPYVSRMLAIRQSLGLSSVTKLTKMLSTANEDGRIRGMFWFHKASTGRWASRGVQLQNLVRDSYDTQDVERAIAGELEGCPIVNASKCVRGVLTAKDGYTLLGADFSAIEARVLAWLAGESHVLQAFRDNRDLYVVAASGILHKKYEDITKEERQLGKIAVLALGYQGWYGAFTQMAQAYGMTISEEQAIPIMRGWRESHPAIVQYWADVENAAIQCVETKQVVPVGCIKFGYRNDFMHIRLPSGRLLAFYKPEIAINAKGRRCVEFWGMKQLGTGEVRKWQRIQTYGGKLTENITQAVARDILGEAMLRVHAFGYDVVMHVHDEICTEVPAPVSPKDVKTFEQIISIVPDWAHGLPLAAEGWTSKRY